MRELERLERWGEGEVEKVGKKGERVGERAERVGAEGG